MCLKADNLKLLSCTTLTLLLSSVWTLMSILFSRLINSSLLCMLSDNGHSYSAQWQCFVCTKLYHIKSDENSSAVVHQCNSDSESKHVDFCQLWLSEMQYMTSFKMLSYVKTFQWVLWQLQVTWSCCSLLCMQQWCTHCHLNEQWEWQQHQWEWVHC
jgi:hypothetical protein